MRVALVLPIVALLCGAGSVDVVHAQIDELARTARPVSLITVSVFNGTGANLDDAVVDASSGASKFYIGMNAAIAHVRRGRTYTFSAGTGTSVRYFASGARLQMIDRSARIGFDKAMGGRGRLQISQSLLYTPFRRFGLIGDSSATDFSITDADNAAAVGRPSYDAGTQIGFSHALSRRIDLGMSYTGQRHYTDVDNNMLTHRAGAEIRIAAGRSVAIVLGTATRSAQMASNPKLTIAQDVDIGVDYNRALSFSRNTKFNIRTGSAVVGHGRTSADGDDAGRRLLALGSAALNHNFTRHWAGSLAYERNLRFIEGFSDPFYAETIVARISAVKGRRLNFAIDMNYSKGKALSSRSADGDVDLRGLQQLARINYVVSRRVVVHAEQHFSNNRLSNAALASLGAGIVPRRGSHGIRAGVTMSVPHVH